MNILIVDDQKAVVDGLKNELDWNSIGIEEVYTATSAREAKLLLVNFDIQILLSDIEMPEEDGLSLLRWTKEHYPEIVGIFLTSHADFDYAREALQLGCFDYILQPARNEDVISAVTRAQEQVRQNARIQRLEKAGRAMEEQRDSIMELLIVKAEDGRWNESKELFARMKSSAEAEEAPVGFWSMEVQICRFEKKPNEWTTQMLKMVFRNVLEELFEEEQGKTVIAQGSMEDFLVMLAVKEDSMSPQRWERGVTEFYEFINSRMDFKIAVYPENCEMKEFRPERYEALKARKKANVPCHTGIYWEDVENGEEDINAARIRSAEEYIRSNLHRSLSRTEVADYLHLNEEYFSRLFKKYTGYTYKDYEMKVRMDQARKLLEHSRISVSIIASKVGYDNFSHFSRAFKKEVGMTPQEYRKEKNPSA